MSLLNTSTKSAALLPDVPLPAIFANMRGQMFYKNQYQLEMVNAVVDAQKEYFVKGYQEGHLKGFDQSTELNFQNGVNNGFKLGAKTLIEGDNHMIVDKKNLGNVLSAPTLPELMEKIPGDSEVTAFYRKGKDERSKLYGTISAFIRLGKNPANSQYMYLDVAKVRTKVQDPTRGGIIKGKYIVPTDGVYEYWNPNMVPKHKPTTSGFNELLDSMIQPAPPSKYKGVSD
jgi:hypothetical protein